MKKTIQLLCMLLLGHVAQIGSAQTLVHYWNFNVSTSEATLLAPSLSLVSGASIVHIQGGASLIPITGNTGSGFEVTNPNARNGDAALSHLRFNNPIGGTLVFALPTTGYQQIVVKYGTRRSGSGAGTQKIEYTLDGLAYDSLTVIAPIDGDPTVQTLDFSGITGVNNNPNFGLRITFSQGSGGLVGNNRFDNITLEGNTFGADNTPPIVQFSPVNGTLDVSTSVQPTITFNEDVRLVSDAAISNADLLNIVALRRDSLNGAAVPFTGSIAGKVITLVPNTTLENAVQYFVVLLPNTVEDASNNAVTNFQSAGFTTISPQTVFQAGDLVPVAYRMNATATGDEIAFLTFIDILPGTKINLTDAKYTDNTPAQCAGGIVWTSPASIIPSGTVFTIQNDAGTASVGTVTGSTFGLSSGGDQVIVYTGTPDAPSYITALSSNAWLAANTVCNGSFSKIPGNLADGINAINLSTAPGNTAGNTVNGYYSGIQDGTVAELRASILNPANWNGVGAGTPPQVWPAWAFPGPPQVVSAAVLSQTSLQLVFNRDMDAISVANLANYTGITGLVSVNKSNNGSVRDTLVLTYGTPFLNGASYTLSVVGLKDTDNRSMVGAYTFTFSYDTRIAFANRFTSVAETEGSVSFNLQISNPSTASVNLVLKTGKFSTAGTEDITFANQTITLDGNSAPVRTITIPVVNDNLDEQAEYFVLALEQANGVAINGSPYYTIYIRDNDRQAPAATKSIELEFKARYTVANPDDAAGLAEIVTYDPGTKRLFTMSTGLKKFDIVDFANPENPLTIQQIDVSSYGTGITSIAARNGVVAVSVPGINNEQENGSVVFFNTDGVFLKQVTVGALPDMITFTPDGKSVLTANEGQPNDAYTNDPEGSVSIINIEGGIANLTQANVTTVDFTAFNAQANALIAAGVRRLKASSTMAQDFEPEYITIAADSKTAWVTLQENNAVAVLDLTTKTFTAVAPLGTKDYSLAGNGLDLSDQGGFVHIANWPVKGFYLPDAITNYVVNGNTYLVTANEGDEKEYAGLNERTTVGAATTLLDSTAFPNAAVLKENHNMGRFRISNLQGDTDGDGDFDELYAVGARSFSIWNAANGSLVFDSGDDFEQITAADPYTAPIFNADNEGNAPKGRSRAKGPEPEGVTLARVNDRMHAFVVLERVGGVMVYDIEDPANPVFVDYKNSRDNTQYAGDNGPEGIIFVPASNGKFYIVTANELSGTLAIFEVKNITTGTEDVLTETTDFLFPNPVTSGSVSFNRTQDVQVYNVAGQLVAQQNNTNKMSVAHLPNGCYFVHFANGKVAKMIVQQ